MAGRKKTGENVNDSATPEADDDSAQTNPSLGSTEAEADTDDADEGNAEFLALVGQYGPKGITLVDLQPDFVRPEGFLMVPRLNKKTGEIAPMSATFVGILHDIIPWKDKRGKERVWFACECTADIPGAMYTGIDEKTDEEFQKPLVKGTRVGISGSGALNALKTKKGHFMILHWTGNKVPVKNGDMWEVKAKVSDTPVVPQG